MLWPNGLHLFSESNYNNLLLLKITQRFVYFQLARVMSLERSTGALWIISPDFLTVYLTSSLRAWNLFNLPFALIASIYFLLSPRREDEESNKESKTLPNNVHRA
jgi:hypothetical protein